MNTQSTQSTQHESITENKNNRLAKILRVGWSLSRITTAVPTGIFFGFILFLLNTPFTTKVWLILISYTIPLMWFLNSWNDIFDQESDALNPKKGSMFYGWPLQKNEISIAIAYGVIGLVIVVTIAILTNNLTIIAATLVGLFLGFAYSTPPFRFKEVPVINYICATAVLPIFIVIGLALDGTISANLLRGFISLELLMIGMTALGEAGDHDFDLEAGDRTVATTFGKRGAILIGWLGWIIGLAVSFNLLPLVFKIYVICTILIITIYLINPKHSIIAAGHKIIFYTSLIPIVIEFTTRLIGT